MLGERYELGAMIGTGGMADVYLAQDVRLNRQVAIKILRSDLARDPSFVTRFNKEALSVAALNHPGIVSVYDSGKEDSPSGAMPYIVMEYVEGKTLREALSILSIDELRRSSLDSLSSSGFSRVGRS
ncbi:MAG: hypothetical protein EBY10_04785 [Actinobacteria bacterium]|nr:hypothetical protein [Actinomycetota bacterium]